jgi:iron complex transport system permease protein
VPHVCRRLVGTSHAWLYAASALLGAALLVGADALARVLLPSGELPVGIVTALVGGPFFLFIFRTRLGRC